MSTNTFAENINKSIETFRAEREEFKKKTNEFLFSIFKEFFERNPEVNVIYWTQYTPYFNDGDPCYFSVNFDGGFAYIKDIDYNNLQQYTDGYDIDEMEVEDGSLLYHELVEKYPKLGKDMYAIDELLNHVDFIKETLQDLGEGTVMVTEKGINVFDLDHD